MSAKLKRPNGILQNIITYFCFKVKPLSMLKLTKLVYLVDVYHWQMFGKRLTEVGFIHYHYGAWAPDISIALEDLYEAGIIQEKKVITKKGFPASVPEAMINQAMINLPKTAFEVLESVVADWGDASTEEIVKFTKTTLPFLNTDFECKIDFCRSDAVTTYASEKNTTENDAATKDVLSSKALAKAVIESIKDAKNGHFLTHKQIFG